MEANRCDPFAVVSIEGRAHAMAVGATPEWQSLMLSRTLTPQWARAALAKGELGEVGETPEAWAAHVQELESAVRHAHRSEVTGLLSEATDSAGIGAYRDFHAGMVASARQAEEGKAAATSRGSKAKRAKRHKRLSRDALDFFKRRGLSPAAQSWPAWLALDAALHDTSTSAALSWRAWLELGPVQRKIRVPLFAARTLYATGQYRVTLSLR